MKKKKILVPLTILALLILAAVGILTWMAKGFLDTPASDQSREVIVTIEPGQSFKQVAAMLEDRDVITSAYKFRLMAEYYGLAQSIKAGEFALNTGWRPKRVLDALTRGQEVLYTIVIPEGLTWRQTGQIVADSGLADFESFEKTVFNPGLLAEYNIPADSAEGFLYPETYHVPRPKNRDAKPIVRTMLATFRKQTGAGLWPDEPPPADELLRIVTLASLVEKETAVAEERGLIAGVYANRLRRGMLLQCDPTVIYGLGEDFDGNLTKAHLEDRSNKYNTYKHPGLPPGPICSPGLDSLMAAQNPEKHRYLYFVSKGDGSHHFSATLREHVNAVNKYQRRRRR